MTKTTTTSKGNARLVSWFGPDAGPALYRYLAESVDPRTGARYHPDLEAELADLIPPKWFSPPPEGETVVFSLPEIDRFLRFARKQRHIKGAAWARKPFEPDLWQVIFVISPLFGWLHEDDDGRLVRVFSTLYLEVPRKNGKSTLAAVIALYLLVADREPGAEIVAAAADREQARAVFDVAQKMAKGSPWMRRRVRPGTRAITVESNASSFKVLSAEAFRKHGLNLHGAVIDELHVHRNREMVETLETATGSRTQPIVVFITTAGLDDPGSIYTEKRDFAEKAAREMHTRQIDKATGKVRSLVDVRVPDPSQLVVIFTVDEDDDPFDETTWKIGNPGYGRSLRPSYMRGQATKARASAAALNGFLRLHLNIRTGQITRWLTLDAWDRSGARHLRPELEELRARNAYFGLDLASAVDLAALVGVLPRWIPDPDDPDAEIEVLDVIVRAWTPKDTLATRAERDRAPYLDWVKEGWLTTTPGAVIDYDAIEDEVKKLGGILHVRRLHFDRWGSKQMIGHLRDELGAARVFEMGQGFASMSAPMKEAEKLVLEERLGHGANPLLRWAVASLAVVEDAAENVKPDRDKSTGRIDPFVALVMAIDAWARDQRGRSVYEDRGLETA